MTSVQKKLSCNERNVRRNLKFTEIFTTTTNSCAKAGVAKKDDNTKRENLRLPTRTSFLLPPNTIKELHIKNRFNQNKSKESQFRILKMNSPENPRISETSESSLPPVENTNAHADPVNAHVKKNKRSIIQSVLSQKFNNVNEQSGLNILHSSYSDLADTSSSTAKRILENLNSNEISNVNICQSQNNVCNVTFRSGLSSDADLCSDKNVDQIITYIQCAECCLSTTYALPDIEKVKEASLIKKIGRERCLSTTTNVDEDLHPPLQTVKMMSEPLMDLQRSAKEDEYVTLSKTELAVLASKLNHLVSRLEEDVSDLKLMQTSITKLLSPTNVPNKEFKEKETKIVQQVVEENLNDNMKVADNTENKLSRIIIDTKHDSALKETGKMLDMNRPNFAEINGKDNVETELSDQMYITSRSNKENRGILNSPNVNQCQEIESKTRRRSARLMAKIFKNSNAANDSFVNLENELDIVNREFNTPIKPLINHTPAKTKYQDKTIEERPMKEYMALKSRMSCLLTPNIKRFNLSESKNNVYRETDDAKISVSDKVLTELYNLYEDSL